MVVLHHQTKTLKRFFLFIYLFIFYVEVIVALTKLKFWLISQ